MGIRRSDGHAIIGKRVYRHRVEIADFMFQECFLVHERLLLFFCHVRFDPLLPAEEQALKRYRPTAIKLFGGIENPVVNVGLDWPGPIHSFRVRN
jgi:hypothetical protein